jgi:hypothetical protein
MGPASSLTRVKLVTLYVLFATKAGRDLAAYFRPANATIYPPKSPCKAPTKIGDTVS